MSSDQNAETLKQFCTRTGADAATAQFWLEATANNLETAVQMYGADNADAPPRQTALDPLVGPSVVPPPASNGVAEAALTRLRVEHEALRRISDTLKERVASLLAVDDPANPRQAYNFTTLTGGKHVLHLRPNAIVIDALIQLEIKTGIPIDQVRFTFNGNVLDHKRALTDYGIAPGATVHMVIRLMGD